MTAPPLFPAGDDVAVAIAAPGRRPLSYAALRDHVGGAALALQSRGVGRTDRVALVLPDGPELATAFLAVTSAAVAAPLNTRYAAAEFDVYLDDLKPSVVLVQAGGDSPVLDVASRRRIPTIEVAPLTQEAAGLFTLDGKTVPAGGVVEPSDDDIALMLHTSGTTARPKRVALRHGQLRASVRNVADALQLTSMDRGLHIMPLFHVHGLVAGLLAPLHAGGYVYCTPGLDMSQFPDWLADARPTWLTAVPTMHQAIAEWARRNPDEARRAHLRFIRSCSAALAESVAAVLEAAFNAPVVEAYAMTEAAHQITCNPLPPAERRHGSVGRPAGPQVAILDSDGRPMAPGETGEVGIRGENVITGYDDNPQANRLNFIGGWFRTGDLGWLDDDGYLWLKGRLKEMINRGGEKISPIEIESVLLAHPAVAQAVVFAVPHPSLGEEVGAAIVLRDGQQATAADLQSHLLTQISLPKVPRRILFPSALPKGPTGKLRRIGLAAMLGIDDAAHARPAFVEPRSPSEQTIVGIWTKVLAIADIGVNDDFFDLGGDSLAAVRIAEEIRNLMGVEVGLSQFLQAPTVAELALAVTEAQLLLLEPAALERLLADAEEGVEGARA